MKFLSYAQNFEDVVLYRALKHVWNGTYVDVGAFDPTRDSVTKAFYDRGWSGINVDPVEAFHRRFVEERPRDRNILAAMSDASGSLPYYVVGETGLSTLDPAIAEEHRRAGHDVRETTVPVLTLEEILREFQGRPIHFLKIDVEGHEAKVLAGLDLHVIRPWILVIEATVPGQATASHETWEARVLEARYRFAYFDGLSRYYVAEEHADLAAVLAIPPNVFDEFETLHVRELQLAVDAARQSYATLSELLEKERSAARAHSEELLHKLVEERENAAELAVRAKDAADLTLADARETGNRALADTREAGERALADVREAGNRALEEAKANTARIEQEALKERERLERAHHATHAQLMEIHRSKAWALIVAYRRALNLVKRTVRQRNAVPAPVPLRADPHPTPAVPELILHKDAGFARAELARKVALRALFRGS